MGLQQQAIAKVNEFSYVPPTVAAAATRYQTFRVIEAEHLALMANHDLSRDWTPEIRQIVFNAGDHVRHARDARQLFRAEVRQICGSTANGARAAVSRAATHAHDASASRDVRRPQTGRRMAGSRGARMGDRGIRKRRVMRGAFRG